MKVSVMSQGIDQGNKRHSEWDRWLDDVVAELEKVSLLRSLRPVRVTHQWSEKREEENVSGSRRRQILARGQGGTFHCPNGMRPPVNKQEQLIGDQRSQLKETISPNNSKEFADEAGKEYPCSDLDTPFRGNPSAVMVHITDATREAWLNNTPSVGADTIRQAVSEDSAAVLPDKLQSERLHAVRLFSGNDYLGLSAHPDISRATARAAVESGNGPRASPLICGYTDYHRQLETCLARLKRTEECLLFPTGFTANLAVITSLCGQSPSVMMKAAANTSPQRVTGSETPLQRVAVDGETPLRRIAVGGGRSSFSKMYSSSLSFTSSFDSPAESSASSPSSRMTERLRSSQMVLSSAEPSSQSSQISADGAANELVGRPCDNNQGVIVGTLSGKCANHNGVPQDWLKRGSYRRTLVNDDAQSEVKHGETVAVFSDALNHASIIDGIRLAEKQSAVVVNVYRHNDMQHLDQLLSECEHKRKLVVTDSLFSMDGDVAPLHQLVELKRKHSFLLVIDEAHATLVFGSRGAGLAEACGVEKDIDIYVGTLSKAVGCHGGFAACNSKWKQLILSRGRSYIFSTALPIPVVAAAIEALSVSEREACRRKVVHDRVLQFSDAVGIPFVSPICPLLVGDERSTLIAARQLLLNGFHVPAIRPPTVPANSCRLRVTLSAAHTREDVQALVNALPHWVISNARSFFDSASKSNTWRMKQSIPRRLSDPASDNSGVHKMEPVPSVECAVRLASRDSDVVSSSAEGGAIDGPVTKISPRRVSGGQSLVVLNKESAGGKGGERKDPFLGEKKGSLESRARL